MKESKFKLTNIS